MCNFDVRYPSILQYWRFKWETLNSTPLNHFEDFIIAPRNVSAQSEGPVGSEWNSRRGPEVPENIWSSMSFVIGATPSWISYETKISCYLVLKINCCTWWGSLCSTTFPWKIAVDLWRLCCTSAGMWENSEAWWQAHPFKLYTVVIICIRELKPLASTMSSRSW